MLAEAQHRLHDSASNDLSHWSTRFYPIKVHPILELCSPNGLLKRISDADSLNSDVCSAEWTRSAHSLRPRSADKRIAFDIDTSSGANMIINNFLDERSFAVGDDAYSYATDVWPQLALHAWNTVCGLNRAPTSSLRYVMLGDISEDDTMNIIEDIWGFDPSLKGIAGVTPIATYTPADDNFFALLGTSHGSLPAQLLQNYPTQFATKDSVTGAVSKVKSIRNIRVAGAITDPKVLSSDSSDYNYDDFAFSMVLTLQDVDPP